MAKNSSVQPEVLASSDIELNPFDSSFTLSWPQTIKVVLFGIIFVPVRCILIAITVAFGCLTGRIFSKRRRGAEDYEPYNWYSRGLQALMTFLARMCLFFSGVYWVPFKGQLASSKEAPIAVIAPHSSWFDASIFAFIGLKSFVARSESEKNWLTGPIFSVFKPISVTRTSKDSRSKTSEMIVQRAKSGIWPATCIFPEGTCSNGKCLISFKIGAFSPGVPVQPILIRYKNNPDYLSWSFQGTNIYKSFLVLLSQFVSFMEIEALPVYKPSDKEKEDPYLFAHNVRQYMADHLNLPVCNYTYEDGLLCLLATELGLPENVGLIGFDSIKAKLGCCDGMEADFVEQGIVPEDTFSINIFTIKTQLKQFAKMNLNKDGYLTKSELAKFYYLPQNSPHLEALYNVFDKDLTGRVDFASFLMGRFQIMCGNEDNHIVDSTFTTLDESSNGYFTIDNFLKLCKSSDAEIDDTLASSLFDEFCDKKTKVLSKESYKQMFTEYAEIGILLKRSSTNQ